MTKEANKDTPDNTAKSPKKNPLAAPKEDRKKTKRQPLPWATKALIGVLLVITGAASSLYFLPQIKDRLPLIARWVGSEADLSSLQTRLQDHEDRLAQIEGKARIQPPSQKSLGPDPALAIVVERLENLEQIAAQASPEIPQPDKDKSESLSQSARIDMLLGRMSQLESSFVPLSRGLADAQDARLERAELKRLSEDRAVLLAQMEDRLRPLEAFAARDMSGALVSLRLSQLGQRISQGKSFSRALDRLENLLTRGELVNDQTLMASLNWLRNHQDGIAGKALLRQEFHQLIPALIRARGRNAEDPWWKKAYFGLRNLITIRKTDQDPSASSEPSMNALILSMEQSLSLGRLEDALTAVKKLPDPVLAPLSQWIGDATIREDADQRLAQMEDSIIGSYLKKSTLPVEETTGEMP